jgi:hypothetical protein
MLWNREKSLAPAGNQTLDIQPIARHYTIQAIPAPNKFKNAEKTGQNV